jgi:predicted ATPase
VPAADAGDEDDPLRYGGVRLFIERLRAAEPHFAPDRRSVAMIAAICRRLDGIPLAIELAAARAAVLGVEEVATHLDDRFRILTGGRRTALPRHQTLRATLDWSYELLSEPERVILRRLAVFAGVFRLEAASAVIASPEIAPAEVVAAVSRVRGAVATNSFSKTHVGPRLKSPVTNMNRIMSPKATIPGEPCATSSGMSASLTAAATKPTTTERT